MSFNAKKCQVIRITPKNRPPLPTTYKLHGHTLDTVEASKYLGVTISNNLTWDRHMDTTIGKCNKTLEFIRRNLKDCIKPVKSAVYIYIYIHGETNNGVCKLRMEPDKPEKVQKRAARFIFNNYTDRTPDCVTEMVESLKWEKLEERRKTNRLCMLCKIKNGLIDIDSHQYIQSNDSRTRGKDRFYQERTSSEAFGNSFFPKTIRD